MGRGLFSALLACVVFILPNGCVEYDSSNVGKKCAYNAECPDGYICDLITKRCKKGCVPDCGGKCCGSDGCGGTCPDNCLVGKGCDPVSCQCWSDVCFTDDDCMAVDCCLNGVCVSMSCGTLQCGPDPVCGRECGPCGDGWVCDQGTCVSGPGCTSDHQCEYGYCCRSGVCWPQDCRYLDCGPDPVCGRECGPCPEGYYCDNGNCLLDGVAFCPPGQECVQVGASGLLGCVIPPNSVPPENSTDCAWNPCRGNFSCHCLDQNCSQSVCVENCGSCPTGMQCCRLWDDGPWGCLIGDCSDLPYNPPYCDEYTPCQGNANCFTDGTNNFCIEMCSVSGGACVEGTRVCQGDIVMQCEYGHWVERADCASSNRECIDGGCHSSGSLGDFCDNGVCSQGLDCLPDPAGGRSFCTHICNCGTVDWYCDDGWGCRISNQPGDPRACWCAKMCPSRNPYIDCPNGGVDWECVYSGTDRDGNELYVCMPD